MTISRARRRFLAGATAGVVGAGGVLAATAPMAQAATLPTPTVLGGPGHATVYASGLEVGPDGTLVVADTGNDSIAKFSASGTLIWRVSGGTTDGDEAENARDIAIDSSGDVYVGDAALSRVIKLSGSTGATLGTWTGPSTDKIGSPIGLTYKDGKGNVIDSKKKATVSPQCTDRKAANSVYCSCRCANINGATDDGAVYCKCPEGFECKQLVSSIGQGNEGLTGGYCIKSGTAYDQNNACGNTCDPTTQKCD